MSELLTNSNLDVFPGQSKLYLHSKDLEDLDWPAMLKNSELDKPTNNKLDKVIHDRLNENEQQMDTDTTLPGHTNTGQGQPQGQGRGMGRPTQTHRLPNRLKDCITVVLQM